MVKSKTDTAASAAENVQEKAAEFAQSAKAEATRRAEGAKFSLSEEIASVASALKVASGEFSDESTESKTFNQLAEALSGASEAIRQKNLSEMVSDLNGFARRNPAAFLGTAALLGFMGSRFARASGEAAKDRTEVQDSSEAAP
ncbi:hypothetical protein [Chelativorans salis]|uniref:Uncharacterized protein n=1 Tax=Chelativorans salis TaxID=2978478 RepID=A0ABT2LHQ7_9HYPH|nr:hypothetical protein [Chelativorans sp. EGI FJ00035]MCT7374096.1 hypothetical protein [Chelativorans sp. EGI FJ00035]